MKFAVTWDYLCPFARNAHEHLVTGIAGGADWEVEFVPFSLMQAHAEVEPVWGTPARGLLALNAGVVVRDRFPEAFPEVHRGLFSARHDDALHIDDREVIAGVVESSGLRAADIFAEIDDGWPEEAVRQSHEAAVADHHVFGVPTFILGNAAVFVRIMTRPEGDVELARKTIERVLGLLEGHPEINEFKHTSIPR